MPFSSRLEALSGHVTWGWSGTSLPHTWFAFRGLHDRWDVTRCAGTGQGRTSVPQHPCSIYGFHPSRQEQLSLVGFLFWLLTTRFLVYNDNPLCAVWADKTNA